MNYVFVVIPKHIYKKTIGRAGLEPARAYAQQILSLGCLPIPPPSRIGMTGFEPAASRSQSECSTKLSYIPISNLLRVLYKDGEVHHQQEP